MIQFVVHGAPVPQGSKVKTRWGMREDNPHLLPWREAVRAAAAESAQGTVFLADVEVSLLFQFQRPKSHYGTGRNVGVLKENAPVFKTSKPDIDKLTRGILDGLTGVVLRDDAQVVVLSAMKTWGDRDETTVSLWERQAT